uniref:SH3 domain-containing protein n=1 Tax=Wuchereria bancrofti TaxID=6293 RepID=A0AAF5PL56_WUCBA
MKNRKIAITMRDILEKPNSELCTSTFDAVIKHMQILKFMYSTLRCHVEAKQKDIRRKISSQIFRRKTTQGKNASLLQHKKICKICIKLNSNRSIGEKTRSIIRKWSENECKQDASLDLIKTLYKNLLVEGYSFETDASSKSCSVNTDSNAVRSAEEEEEALVLAIAKSLQETSIQNDRVSSIYSPVTGAAAHSSTPKLERDVRALYDFEAVENNELTFSTGDIITVIDDSDLNWWRGRSHRGEGLFPASFVISDLLPEESEPLAKEKAVSVAVSVARIDKTVLEECLRILEDCDPTGERPDPPELADLEQRSLAQAPLIDARLAEIDRQHNALAQVDIAIRDVLSMYDRAVEQAQYQVSMQQPSAQPVFRYQVPEIISLPTIPSNAQWDTASAENMPM